jgi:DNA replication and repair protein RecF
LAAAITHRLEAAGGGVGEKRLALTRLALTDFRNYARCAIALEGRSVVLTGRNGSGKTNILEAVSLLTPGRGLRGAPFAELARLAGDGGWAVSARLARDGDETNLGTGQQAGTQAAGNTGRQVRVDREQASGSGALGDYLQAVWLIPAMDGLFTGPGSERRRFLDRIVATFDGAHRTRLNHFERAMRQRNRLLETGERSARLFEAIESQMAEIGTAVAAARIEAAERLADAAIGRPDGAASAFPHAVLALEGTLEAALGEAAAVDVEDLYARQLAENRERDRAAGRTLIGPHRSDLLLRHGPKDMPAHLCSTGEQKALLIGLVLAHAKAVKDLREGLAPLLLLDEIAAHLDGLRREALFDGIERLGSQAWLTGTDQDVFAPLASKAQFLTIADGVVLPSGSQPNRLPKRPATTG